MTKIDKDGNESVVTISYKIKFIDSARFMAISLSNLVDNLSEEIHKIKCKDYNCILAKDNLIKYKYLSCNKNYSSKIDEELKKKFKNIFEFSNNYINKFILLRIKSGYPFEYMDDWESLMKQYYLRKKNFIAT